MIFETHAHYDDEAFDEDRDELIPRLYEEGITRVVNISVNRKTCEDTLRLMEKYPFIYGTLGFHPSDCADFDETQYEWMLDTARKNEKIVAIGEIGLDYHYLEPMKAPDTVFYPDIPLNELYPEDPDKALQKRVFIRQLELAKELSLPVVIHSRDAAKDTMDIIKEHGRGLTGVIHCYSYHTEDALQYIRLGFNIGVGGVVTYKNAHKLKEVVERIPIENIVIETDCPYLSPEPFRGKRNSSMNLPYIIQKIAELKGITMKEAEDITYGNAVMMYRL
ncbi:MAG TPA: hydrolase TatD [Lachnospiraceae bacterium]|nr:hydrolase TatD [Lachnospiraceae bacterium]